MILQVWSAFPTSPISQLRTSKPQKIKWLKVLPRPTSVLGAQLTVQNVIITLVFWSTSEAVSQKTWATLRSGQYYSFIMFTFGTLYHRYVYEGKSMNLYQENSLSHPFLVETLMSPSPDIEGSLCWYQALQGPSTSMRSLFPGLQRHKDTVRSARLGWKDTVMNNKRKPWFCVCKNAFVSTFPWLIVKI